MAEEYRPAKREVLGEMWGKFKSDFSDFSGAFVTVFPKVLVAPYAIPTATRVARSYFSGIPDAVSSAEIETSESIPQDSENSDSVSCEKITAEDAGITAAIMVGAAAYIVQGIAAYDYAPENPKVLLIPVVTNAISGAYEIGKRVYENAEQRMIGRCQPESLESKAQME